MRLLNGHEVWHSEFWGINLQTWGVGVGAILKGHIATMARCHMFYLEDYALCIQLFLVVGLRLNAAVDLRH